LSSLHPAPRAGEPTANSLLLQARLARGVSGGGSPSAGYPGVARFEIADNPNFGDSRFSAWQLARADTDFVVRVLIDGLKSGSTWYWRVHHGGDRANTSTSTTLQARTLRDRDSTQPIRFGVLTCMHRHRFLTDTAAYRDDQVDRHLGFPTFEHLRQLSPNFVCFTGDCVYYDHPRDAPATEPATMRDRWHRQFDTPRSHALLGSTAGYWLKDDHDFRFDDSDLADKKRALPTAQDGLRIFREQCPVSELERPQAPMWRTHRLNRDVQVWLLEGRDHRSPNAMPDGPDKTLWGLEQRAWLKQTLATSDARFRILISPTPLVGPDDARKTDNHTNIGGFQHERDAFLDWAEQQQLIGPAARPGQLLVICGDRHWQYHSVHPLGLHEISCGSTSDGNARRGRSPGDPRSTDPEGLIQQRWAQDKVSGGFVMVEEDPRSQALTVYFMDDHGRELHRIQW